MVFKCVMDHFSTQTVTGTRHESVDGQRKVGRDDSRWKASGAFGHSASCWQAEGAWIKHVMYLFFAELFSQLTR